MLRQSTAYENLTYLSLRFRSAKSQQYCQFIAGFVWQLHADKN